jgi:competence protein ComEC
MGEVSLVAVVVNVLVLPMVPVAMLLTFFTGILALFIPALPVAFLAHLSLSYIVVVATWFATLPFAAVTIPTFPPIAVFLSYAGIALFVWWLKRAPASSNEFKDWVIEEESDTKVGEELRSSPTKPDLPIFFR